MNRDEPRLLQDVVSKTGYPIDAFEFLRRGLDFTVHRMHKHPERVPEGKRHVSGQQLCMGLRDYALERYGFLARTLLRRWCINRTEDFGSIVFAMVEGGLMQATEGDSIRDFDHVFDFDDVFDVPISLEKVPPEGFHPAPVHQE